MVLSKIYLVQSKCAQQIKLFTYQIKQDQRLMCSVWINKNFSLCRLFCAFVSSGKIRQKYIGNNMFDTTKQIKMEKEKKTTLQ